MSLDSRWLVSKIVKSPKALKIRDDNRKAMRLKLETHELAQTDKMLSIFSNCCGRHDANEWQDAHVHGVDV